MSSHVPRPAYAERWREAPEAGATSNADSTTATSRRRDPRRIVNECATRSARVRNSPHERGDALEIAIDEARRLSAHEPVVAFGEDLHLKEVGPHRGVERGDALVGRRHLVGRTEEGEDGRRDPGQRKRRVVVEDPGAEVPDRLFLEHELQPGKV